LFIAGVLFAYFLVLPKALLFFYDWSGDLGVSNDWRIGEYITFATQFVLLFGLSFELPVVVMVLVKLGLLSYETMSRTRSYAILAIYVAAALITPTPDIMTLNLMALPMLVLYEICIWLAWLDRKKAREAEAREEEEIRIRRLEWMRADEEHVKAMDEEGDAGASGDDGWHADYHHEADGHWQDEYQLRDHDKPTHDADGRAEDSSGGGEGDDIPEEERKRMNDFKGNE
jgi:hypothetical protein